MMKPSVILLTVAGLLLIAGAPAARGENPALDDLRALVRDRQYAEALKQIASALQLKGPAAKGVDRYNLLLLKAECHLQSKATSMALESYALAAKEAPDPAAKSVAQAHEHLLKQSKAFAYQPRSPAGPPKPAVIDILDVESRKKAFAALFLDEQRLAEPKLKAAREARSLLPIAAAVSAIDPLEGLERAATGDAEKVSSMRKELTTQAQKATADALRDLNKRLSDIDKEANTFVPFYQETYDPAFRFPKPIREKVYKKKGLTDAQTKALHEVTITCDKVPPALSELAKALRTEEKSFDPQSEEAGRIRREADRVLDTDYQRIYKEIPKK
jgi:hypothetical protein